ncbi:hypothetical protein Pst134EA_007496 [Puccinia striiformis f. sp. tritici]|uniref:hypothetical protein n=1 Tax=Puccinia striiformis f. sp. tritici TaxID=168172 RepID=UPI002007A700|nr:hypothetical protein Pst134EA_007496 [Puccinia striiformis f. sp. tritici]KAH9460444.1 hypothetical protein Pst134EB_008616 [Puccinia striiformis f. sp. tritici]KAH9470231.1 hypothetical protein Pst134EA_007496 [Puccinia striiformis f. sp. tritici]KAI9616849.1 hypothetical protein H4Q26_010483 [Puccinia striiformis f. sp. tritici PST-130]
MNCFLQGHITFALVALVFALYSRRTEAEAVLCAKHFNQIGKVNGRASCITYPNTNQDYSCSRASCATTDGTNIRWSDLTIRNCFTKSGTKDPVHVAQYYRQNSYADVMDYQGAWWQCNFSAFEGNQRILGESPPHSKPGSIT